jgi:hypothetical protein
MMRRGAVLNIVNSTHLPAPAAGTKICDTPRGRKNGAQPPITSVLYCPGTSTCRMHPTLYSFYCSYYWVV